MNNLLDGLKSVWKRNGLTVLTCLGGAGLIATSVMSVRATPKALCLLKQAEDEKGGRLTKIETVKIAGPTYIPSIAMGASTLLCIVGIGALNKHQRVALTSAYALVDQSFKEYKNKVKELYGEETHQNIVDSIAIEKAKDVHIHSECLVTNCDLSLDEYAGNKVLFYDEYASRYFESSIEQVISAEYHLNRNFVLRGYAALNEFYDFLGLEPTDYGSTVGWTITDDAMFWIDFNHRKIVMDDGLECYVIETPFAPEVYDGDY